MEQSHVPKRQAQLRTNKSEEQSLFDTHPAIIESYAYLHRNSLILVADIDYISSWHFFHHTHSRKRQLPIDSVSLYAKHTLHQFISTEGYGNSWHHLVVLREDAMIQPLKALSLDDSGKGMSVTGVLHLAAALAL